MATRSYDMKSVKFKFFPLLALALLYSLGISLSSLDAQTDDRIYILAVDWNADGSQIAAVGIRGGTDDGYIFVLDVTTGETLYRLETPYGGFATVAWSPDSRFIAVGGYDQTVKLIDLQSGEMVATLVGHRWVVDSLDWNSDGTRLVSSSSGDQQVIVWDATTYESTRRIEVSDIWVVAFSPDDRHIALGGGPGLWLFPSVLMNRPQGSVREQYHYASGYLGALAWSRDSTRIAFGNQTFQPAAGERPNPQVVVMDSVNGAILSNFEIQQGKAIFSIAWSPDNEVIAAYGLDGSVSIWDVAKAIPLDSFPGNVDYIARGLGFSPYGGRLAYGGSIPSDFATSAAAQTEGVDAVQALANSGIQVVVPDASLDRLNSIAQQCVQDANSAERAAPLTRQPVTESTLSDFVATIETLAEDAIPPACRADLLAVAEAIHSR